MLQIEAVTSIPDRLGEGPLWDVREQRLYWVDSYARAVRCMDPRGGDPQSWQVPEIVGSLALRAGGGAVVALRGGFYFLDFRTGGVDRIHLTQPGELRARMNDGKVDRQGRFVVGSMDHESSDPVGRIFQLDTDLTVRTLDTGFICSNGPCWSPDGRTLYLADTHRKAIYAYDYDPETGEVRARRRFASFEGLRGPPDGATVDEEGCLWSVEVFSGRLIRFDPEGVVDRIVGLPVASATSLTFGGADLDIAFVTSMSRPIRGAYPSEREAGLVFAVKGLGVRGIPEPRFAG